MKTIQKKLNRSLVVLLFTSAMMWAWGQKAAAQNDRPMNKQQYYEQQQKNAQMSQPASPEKRTALTRTKKAVPAAKNTAAASTMQPKSKEQLQHEKKQAANKGQSTSEYDQAIKELNQNQTK